MTGFVDVMQKNVFGLLRAIVTGLAERFLPLLVRIPRAYGVGLYHICPVGFWRHFGPGCTSCQSHRIYRRHETDALFFVHLYHWILRNNENLTKGSTLHFARDQRRTVPESPIMDVVSLGWQPKVDCAALRHLSSSHGRNSRDSSRRHSCTCSGSCHLPWTTQHS